MKALKTLVAIALSAGGLGSAVTLGIASGSMDRANAAATITSVTLKGSFDGWGNGVAFTKDGSGDYNLTYSLSTNVQFKVLVQGGGDQWVGYNWGIDASQIDYDCIDHDGENFKMTSSQSLVFKVKSTFYSNYGSDVTIHKNTITSYTVTKHAVLDGVLQSGDIGTDIVPSTDTYAVPASIKRAGYHFVGWYTNQACTTAYTAGTLSGNLDLFAKYTSLVDDTYIYYVTGSTNTCNDYIYTFDGDKEFGNWPGTKITDVAGVQEVHGVMSFQGTAQNIYKIPFASASGDDGLIIHNNSGTQTVDMSLVSHSAYWFITDPELVNYHNDDAGAALDLILNVEAKRNAVTASGNIAAYSICGISASDAASLYNTYYGLTSSVKTTYVDNSTTYTYNGTDTGNQTNVSFADIMVQLKAIALRGNQTVLGSSRPVVIHDNHSALVVVTIIALLTVSGTGTFFLLRKKKEQ